MAAEQRQLLRPIPVWHQHRQQLLLLLCSAAAACTAAADPPIAAACRGCRVAPMIAAQPLALGVSALKLLLFGHCSRFLNRADSVRRPMLWTGTPLT